MSTLEMRFENWWAAKYRDISKHQTLEYLIAKDAWEEAIKTKGKECGSVNLEELLNYKSH